MPRDRGGFAFDPYARQMAEAARVCAVKAQSQAAQAMTAASTGVVSSDTRIAALEAAVSGLQTAVAALQALQGKFTAGEATVPALLLGASTTVQVTLSPAQPDTAFTAVALITGGASILSALSVTSYTIVSRSRVDVTVKASGLISAGAAQVVVIAHRP